MQRCDFGAQSAGGMALAGWGLVNAGGIVAVMLAKASMSISSSANISFPKSSSDILRTALPGVE